MIELRKTYETNRFGPIIVLSAGTKPRYYVVRFLQTNTEKEFREDQILIGCIRDPYARNVCGVACTGDIKTKGKYGVFYSIWHDMINRCYNPHNKRYDAYKDVEVDKDWLVFENFYNEASLIDGFDEKKIINGTLVLDKDIKQRFVKKKIYSKDTCIWIDKNTNNGIQDGQQKPFVAVSPNGEYYKGFNISSFARNHNLSRRHVSGVLHGRAKSTKGWKFQYMSSEDIV